MSLAKRPPDRKRFRPYQSRAVDRMLAARSAMLESPTGSGKTLVGLVLMRCLADGPSPHTLVIAPQNHIREGFILKGDLTVSWPGKGGRKVTIGEGFVREAAGSAEILAYLATPNPGYALAATHAALASLFRNHRDKLPADLSGVALACDEAHHVAAAGLGAAVDEFEAWGSRVYYLTATPFRTDGRDVVRSGMLVIRRALAEHMEGGHAPKRLDNAIIPVGRAGNPVSAGVFTGEVATDDPETIAETADAIAAHWLASGRPKTIVRVPVVRGGSGLLVEAVVGRLRAGGARVFDATGVGAGRQAEFLAMLDSERALTYADSAYDAIVGVQRVVEGTDWPHCHAVSCIGLPRSMNMVMQLIGRGMREKLKGLPEDVRNLLRVAFFVPTAGGEALERLPLEHSRHALLTCMYMADYQVGMSWEARKAAVKGMKGAVRGVDAADAIEGGIRAPADDATMAEVRLMVAAAVVAEPDRAVREIVAGVVKSMPGVTGAAVNQVVVEMMTAGKDRTAKKVGGGLTAKVKAAVVAGVEINEAMAGAFAELVETFRAETLKGNPVVRAVEGQLHGLTAGGIGGMAVRLSRKNILTIEQIIEWLRKWKEKTGKWPLATSGVIPDSNGNTWAAVSSALTQGCRGLHGGVTLGDFIDKYFGRTRKSPKYKILTEELILSWIVAWRDRTGNWPSVTSGIIPESNGENWSNINAALAKGSRGLPGGSSVSELARRKLDKHVPPRLTREIIVKWIEIWHKDHGQYPCVSSGLIPGTNGEKWRNIDAALRVGGRGLTGKSSLFGLISDYMKSLVGSQEAA